VLGANPSTLFNIYKYRGGLLMKKTIKNIRQSGKVLETGFGKLMFGPDGMLVGDLPEKAIDLLGQLKGFEVIVIKEKEKTAPPKPEEENVIKKAEKTEPEEIPSTPEEDPKEEKTDGVKTKREPIVKDEKKAK
jgi:hypothetical protein